MLKYSYIIKNYKNYAVASYRGYHYQTKIYNVDQLDKSIQSDFYKKLEEELAKSYENANQEPNLSRFINAYRRYGFKKHTLNPLGSVQHDKYLVELDPSKYGLNLSAKYDVKNLLYNQNFSENNSVISLADIENILKSTYSTNLTIEFEHILSEEEKFWIAKEFEQMHNVQLNNDSRVNILKLLLKSQVSGVFIAVSDCI